jgi:hypothetical protein
LSLPIQPTADDWQPSQPESIPAATFSHHQPLITSLAGGQPQSAVSRINLSQDVVSAALGGNNNQQQISRIQLLEPQPQDSHDQQLAAALNNSHHQLPQQQTRIQLLQQPDNNLQQQQQPRIQLLTTPDPHDNNHQQQATRIQVLQHHSSSNPSIQILDSLTGIDTADIHQRESINGINLDDIGKVLGQGIPPTLTIYVKHLT